MSAALGSARALVLEADALARKAVAAGDETRAVFAWHALCKAFHASLILQRAGTPGGTPPWLLVRAAEDIVMAAAICAQVREALAAPPSPRPSEPPRE